MPPRPLSPTRPRRDSINRRIVGGKSQGEVKAWIEANLIIIGIAAALLTILLLLNLTAVLYFLWQTKRDKVRSHHHCFPPPLTSGRLQAHQD